MAARNETIILSVRVAVTHSKNFSKRVHAVCKNKSTAIKQQ